MKQFSALLFVFFVVTSWAKAELIPVNVYHIISDVVSDSVPEGKCLVQGKVYEGYSEEPVVKGLVVSNSSQTYTDEAGNFTLYLSDQDTMIYFYHAEYGEIVCWNYDFKSRHLVTLNFVTDQKAGEMPVMVEKPVLYLYSNKDKAVNLNVKPKGDFVFTYPQIADTGWDCKVGESLEVNGQTYPYLFWEAKFETLTFLPQQDGVYNFIVQTDSIVSFLETNLKRLGLNDTESTDFITYWGPRLMQNNFVHIQFWVDAVYSNEIARLEMSENPDQSRRVYMVYKGYNQSPSQRFSTQINLPSLKRSGFTLVEWGGSALN